MSGVKSDVNRGGDMGPGAGAEEPTNAGAILHLVIVCAVIGVLTLIANMFIQRKEKPKEAEETDDSVQSGSAKKQAKKSTPKAKAVKTTQPKVGVVSFEHEDLVATFKGHATEITDISLSSNGKYMASVCSEDRSIIIWSTKDIATGSAKNMIRGKVDLDNPVSVDFSPDCRALALGLEMTNTVRIVKFGKKDGGTTMSLLDSIDFPPSVEGDILTCAVSPSQTYVMVSNKKDNVHIVSLKGEFLGKIDAKFMGGVLSHCVVSPCGRFVAFCGYNPELPLYEIDFSNTNVYKGIKKVMIVKGHTSTLADFAFSLDAVSVVTVSRDKTWRVHSIDVRYKDQEEPKFIASGKVDMDDCESLRCLISHNGKMVGVYNQTTLQLFSVVTGESFVTYSDFGVGTRITQCVPDTTSKYIIVCIGKQMLILLNKYHFMATVDSLKKELEKPLSAQVKTRLKYQLEQEQEKLDTILTKM